MKFVCEFFSLELLILPAVNDNIDAGVEDEKEVGDEGENLP